MKILHYVDENRLAWGETWIQLLKELARQGVGTHVVCKSGGTLAGRLAEEGIFFDTYDVPVAWLPWTARGLGKIIDNVKPDVIHTRLSSAARIGGWWGRQKSVPVVATLDKIAKVRYYENSAFLICCSNFVQNDIVRRGFSLDKTTVIYNPINYSEYAADIDVRIQERRALSISDSTKVIVAAGRFDEGKGFEFLIEAFAKLNNIDGRRLIIIGDGPRKSAYLNMVKEMSLEKYIIMPGFVQDVRPWLWASDIFVFPSNAPEAFGVALLEGMACSLPVLGTSVGGPEELIKNGENGFLIPPADSFAIQEALEKLLNNENMLKVFGRQSALIAKNFDVANIAVQTIDTYKSVKSGGVGNIVA